MPPPSSHARVLLTGGTGLLHHTSSTNFLTLDTLSRQLSDLLKKEKYFLLPCLRNSRPRLTMPLFVMLWLKMHLTMYVFTARRLSSSPRYPCLPCALLQAVKSAPFTFVIHTAMPYHTNCSDPVKDFIDPAVKGTTGILRAAHLYGPTIKRVVLTSSSATILNIKNHEKMYNEDSYSPLTLEDAMENSHFAYSTGKTFGERAAWKFCEDNNPSFELSMINNTYTFGPVQRFLTSPSQVNTSNHCILAMVRGEMKHALEPTTNIVTFVDVRDVATAHVRAMTVPEAAGKRFFVVADYFTNKAISEAIRERLPELDEDLPPRDSHDELPAWAYGFDNSRSKAVLGLTYTPLAKCVGDTAESMMQFREASK